MKNVLLPALAAPVLFVVSLVGGLWFTGRLTPEGVKDIPLLNQWIVDPPAGEGKDAEGGEHGGREDDEHGHGGDDHGHADDEPHAVEKKEFRTGGSALDISAPSTPADPPREDPAADAHGHAAAHDADAHGHAAAVDAYDPEIEELTLLPGQFRGMPAQLTHRELREALDRAEAESQKLEWEDQRIGRLDEEIRALETSLDELRDTLATELLQIQQRRDDLDEYARLYREYADLVVGRADPRAQKQLGIELAARTIQSFEDDKARNLLTTLWTEQGRTDRVVAILLAMDEERSVAIHAALEPGIRAAILNAASGEDRR